MDANVRKAAVAGRFYPANAEALEQEVDTYLDEGVGASRDPVAIVGPHAGFVFSGPVAGSAYRDVGDRFERVVLLGPSHYVAFEGIAAPTHDHMETPLGLVPIDMDAVQALVDEGLVGRDDEAHRLEHGLEVHLPFLQRKLGDFTLVPLVIGRTSTTHVAAVINALWQDDRTLVAVSSDLSHYLSWEECKAVDARTRDAIEAFDEAPIGPSEACGFLAVRGLLRCARERALRIHTQDLRNSGDTAGDRDRVVGYGAWVLTRA